MTKHTLFLASLAALSLNAAEADYATQNNSADKAFNELEGKDQSDKDLELKKKELEIERLKLELEKKKLAEEKQQAAQPAPAAYPAPRRAVRTSKFYLGVEGYNASGTQKTTYEADGYDTEEYEESADYTQSRLIIGFGRVNENRFEIGLSSGKKFTGDAGFNDKIEDGVGLDVAWNIVISSLYDSASSVNVLPFFKMGIGYGVYKLTDEFTSQYVTTAEQIVSGEVKLGAGAYIQLNKHVEFSVGYDYTWMAFQPIEYDIGSTTVTEKDSANLSGLNLGFNFHF